VSRAGPTDQRGPDRTAGPEVVVLAPEETHDLRRRVLRQHLTGPEADVEYPADRLPGTLHLGVRDGGEVVAIATLSREPAPGRPEVPAARLRGMAVDPARQGEGLGAAVVKEALRRLAAAGVELCWANARLRALGFYERLGFTPEGEVFESIGLPHRLVVRRVAA